MQKKKRKLNYFRLGIVILVPILCLSLIGFGTYHLFHRNDKEEVIETKKVSQKEQLEPSLESLLRHSLEPVGQTMYIWGGGWNKADTGAGKETKTMGLSSTWKSFYQKQDSSYDYSLYDYQIHDGLDCSGYIGWVIYNTFETEDNQTGYVYESGKMIDAYVNKGWGKKIKASEIQDYQSGDIMANEQHVYLVLDSYEDGSVLLVHSSPPGVRICGTPDAQGNIESQAYEQAVHIMSRYYSDWYEKYPYCTADISFLTDYDQFRWNKKTFKGTDKNVNQIIKSLLSD